MSFFEQTKIQAADSGSLDAFGRWRVASPTSLFDGKVGTGDANLVFSNATSNGTIEYTANNNQACAVMTVNATTEAACVQQSYKRFPYLPGKSQQIFVTFVFGAAEGGIKRRAGYFDDHNGLIFEQDGSQVSFIKRSYASGNIDEETVLQDNWNLDPLNGNGPSGITLNLAKAQILVIDLEWLGVGRVRVGFNIDGVTYYCHQFLHANNITSVYMTTATLPIRYEILNGGLGAAASMQAICSTVISEGGTELLGRPYGLYLPSAISMSANTAYAIFGLRLSSPYRVSVEPTSFSVVGTTVNDYFAWAIWRNPTINGSPSWTAVTDSDVTAFTGNADTTINTSTGTILASGVAVSQQNVALPRLDKVSLEASWNGTLTPIPLCLVVRPYTSINVVGAINWRETT